jgi:hypothetical protein
VAGTVRLIGWVVQFATDSANTATDALRMFATKLVDRFLGSSNEASLIADMFRAQGDSEPRLLYAMLVSCGAPQ